MASDRQTALEIEYDLRHWEAAVAEAAKGLGTVDARAAMHMQPPPAGAAGGRAAGGGMPVRSMSGPAGVGSTPQATPARAAGPSAAAAAAAAGALSDVTPMSSSTAGAVAVARLLSAKKAKPGAGTAAAPSSSSAAAAASTGTTIGLERMISPPRWRPPQPPVHMVAGEPGQELAPAPLNEVAAEAGGAKGKGKGKGRKKGIKQAGEGSAATANSGADEGDISPVVLLPVEIGNQVESTAGDVPLRSASGRSNSRGKAKAASVSEPALSSPSALSSSSGAAAGGGGTWRVTVQPSPFKPRENLDRDGEGEEEDGDANNAAGHAEQLKARFNARSIGGVAAKETTAASSSEVDLVQGGTLSRKLSKGPSACSTASAAHADGSKLASPSAGEAVTLNRTRSKRGRNDVQGEI